MSRELLVSCVMITQQSREQLAMRAVKSFMNQSYPNRELVIVGNDGPLWWSVINDTVRFIEIPNAALTLGDLRNLAIARTKGILVAQWDDDDISHPDRLQRMVDEINRRDSLGEEIDGVYLNQITEAWPTQNRYWISNRRRWECSALMFRYAIPIYPAKKRAEDTPVVSVMKLKSMSAPELYIRTIHGNNTWGENHFESHWINRDRECNDEEKVIIRQFLGE